MIHTDKLGSAVRRSSSHSEVSPVELGSLNPFFYLNFILSPARASLSDQASFLSGKFTGDLGALIERHLLDAGKLLGVIAPFKTRAPPVHIYVQQVICNVITFYSSQCLAQNNPRVISYQIPIYPLCFDLLW
jgi:hypothetical protein